MSSQQQAAQTPEPVQADRQTQLTLQIVARDGVSTAPQALRRSRRRWPIILLIGIAFLVAAGGIAYRHGPDLAAWVSGDAALNPQATEGAAPELAGSVVTSVIGLGKIVPLGDVIALAPPYGASDARIAKIAVGEGDRVAKDSIVAVLDSEPILKAAVAAACANLEVQRAILEQTKAARVASRDEADATLKSARAALENATAEYDRTVRLAARGVVAKATLDQKRMTLAQAAREADRAQATLSRFDEKHASGLQDVLVAERRVAASEADVARAVSELEKAYIRAPAEGTILSLDNRAGEKPASQGIGTMANLNRMTAEVEVYQTSIGTVAIDNTVSLSTDALRAPLTGKVSRIGLKVEKQSLVDASPAANTDARVVKVYVALDPESSKRASAFTNLQVMARIATAAPSQ